MTGQTSPNTFKPYQWACVVSAVVWAEYKLGSGGKLTAETARGPLIIWAAAISEGESVPTLQPPMLSALEEQTAKVNTRAAFERLFWAAGGKVRPSVRWKTGGKVRLLRKWIALAWVHFLARAEARRAAGKSGLYFSHMADRTAKGRREARREVEFERREERLRVIAPAWADEDNPYGWDGARVEHLEGILSAALELPSSLIQGSRATLLAALAALPDTDPETLGDAIAFAALLDNRRALSKLFKVLQLRRSSFVHAFAGLLKHLEAAAYRAHLAKRVKPVTRRTRAPRPLYARPRPPTAPTAPPLLEA